LINTYKKRMLYVLGTIIRYKAIRFMIRTNDHRPPHIHACGMGCEAKIEIETLRIDWNRGFSKSALSEIIEKVQENQDLLLEAWNEIHIKE
jgi:uncharacterized protein (DUF885 family)